jgi:hypothetical protein
MGLGYMPAGQFPHGYTEAQKQYVMSYLDHGPLLNKGPTEYVQTLRNLADVPTGTFREDGAMWDGVVWVDPMNPNCRLSLADDLNSARAKCTVARHMTLNHRGSDVAESIRQNRANHATALIDWYYSLDSSTVYPPFSEDNAWRKDGHPTQPIWKPGAYRFNGHVLNALDQFPSLDMPRTTKVSEVEFYFFY